MRIAKKLISAHYSVFNDGRVYSEERNGTNGGFLSQCPDNYGFMRVCLSINGKTKSKKVHRLVAEAFVPNPGKLPDVIHRNGDLTDNRASNLAWADKSKKQSEDGGYNYTWL